VPPPAHLRAGLCLAKELTPLDRDGRKSDSGLIVLLSIGMSNTTQESRSFWAIAKADSQLNPEMLFVDGAEGAQTAAKIADPASKYWVTVESRLREVEAAVAQVLGGVDEGGRRHAQKDFPVEPNRMQEELVRVLHILHNK